MDDLMNAARREAERVMATRATTRTGLVTSYDPDNYAVKVALQPEGVETGWLPLASPWVGNGWGMFAPPSIGDQVVVEALEGENETRVVLDRLYSNDDRPLSVPSGEFWLQHETGAKIRLLNDGKIEIITPANIEVAADTNIEVRAGANVTIEGEANVTVTGGAKVELRGPMVWAGGVGSEVRRLVDERFAALFNLHTHGTGPVPNQQITTAHLTTHLMGG